MLTPLATPNYYLNNLRLLQQTNAQAVSIQSDVQPTLCWLGNILFLPLFEIIDLLSSKADKRFVHSYRDALQGARKLLMQSLPKRASGSLKYRKFIHLKYSKAAAPFKLS